MTSALDGRVAVVVGSPDSGPVAELAAALTAAGARTTVRQSGEALDDLRPDVVVFAHIPLQALDPLPVAALDETGWDARCEAPIRAALLTAQAAYPHLKGRDGRLIFVCPAVALEGAAGLVPLATAGEAQRMLAKSASRRWAGEGITVNVVTMRLGGGPDAVRTSPARDAGDGAAAAVVWLASAAAAAITGATIGADGGAVMAP